MHYTTSDQPPVVTLGGFDYKVYRDRGGSQLLPVQLLSVQDDKRQIIDLSGAAPEHLLSAPHRQKLWSAAALRSAAGATSAAPHERQHAAQQGYRDPHDPALRRCRCVALCSVSPPRRAPARCWAQRGSVGAHVSQSHGVLGRRMRVGVTFIGFGALEIGRDWGVGAGDHGGSWGKNGDPSRPEEDESIAVVEGVLCVPRKAPHTRARPPPPPTPPPSAALPALYCWTASSRRCACDRSAAAVRWPAGTSGSMCWTPRPPTS